MVIHFRELLHFPAAGPSIINEEEKITRVKAKQNGKFEGFHLVLMKQTTTTKMLLSQLKTFSSSENEMLSTIWKSFKTFLSYLFLLI